MRLGFGLLPASDLEWIAAVTHGRLTPLNDSRILVSGATGFVGRWVVASLAEIRRERSLGDLSLQLLVRNSATARARLGDRLWKEVDTFEADITSPWSLPEPVTHVVHGATPASVRSGSHDRRGGLVTSVLGTNNLIEAVAGAGRCPRVLHLSSGAVYGPQPIDLDRLPETWTGAPSPFSLTAPYAEGKRASEALLEDAGREGRVSPIQARLFAFLGPGLPTDEGFAIGNFVREASRRQTIRVLGDGSTIRSYLEARVLAAWLLLLLAHGETGTPYNVGSPFGRSLRFWAEQCASIGGVGITYGDGPAGDRPAYVPDIANSAQLGIHLATDHPGPALHSWIKWLRVTQS